MTSLAVMQWTCLLVIENFLLFPFTKLNMPIKHLQIFSEFPINIQQWEFYCSSLTWWGCRAMVAVNESINAVMQHHRTKNIKISAHNYMAMAINDTLSLTSNVHCFCSIFCFYFNFNCKLAAFWAINFTFLLSLTVVQCCGVENSQYCRKDKCLLTLVDIESNEIDINYVTKCTTY